MSTMKQGAIGALLSAALIAGCSSPSGLSKTGKGAVIGGAIGGVAGGVISNSVRGTLIGAVLGGVAGAIIGKVMDRRAEDLTSSLNDGRVERVGEGVAIAFDDEAFDAGSARLKSGVEDDLTRVAQQLKDDDVKAIVVGHASDAALAGKRARAVERFLVDKGVDDGRVSSRGETGGGSTVEIALVATDAAKEKARAEARK